MTKPILSLNEAVSYLVGFAHSEKQTFSLGPESGQWCAKMNNGEKTVEAGGMTPRDACDSLCFALRLIED